MLLPFLFGYVQITNSFIVSLYSLAVLAGERRSGIPNGVGVVPSCLNILVVVLRGIGRVDKLTEVIADTVTHEARLALEPSRKNLAEKLAEKLGHGSGDFYCMWHFVEKLRGNPEADIIDVYEALDMFLPGMFAFRSILNGSTPMRIPNLRNPEERNEWRNDTACTDPKVAGDMLLPTCLGGTPDIEEEVYDEVKRRWARECMSKDPNNFRAATFRKGGKK